MASPAPAASGMHKRVSPGLQRTNPSSPYQSSQHPAAGCSSSRSSHLLVGQPLHDGGVVAVDGVSQAQLPLLWQHQERQQWRLRLWCGRLQRGQHGYAVPLTCAWQMQQLLPHMHRNRAAWATVAAPQPQQPRHDTTAAAAARLVAAPGVAHAVYVGNDGVAGSCARRNERHLDALQPQGSSNMQA